VSHSNTILFQLQTLIPRHRFDILAEQYRGDRYMKHFSCWNQLTVMLYSQASGKDSLRDIQHSLLAQGQKLYHLGITSVRRSTLADANKKRDYRIYERLFYETLKRCTDITPRHRFKFKSPLHILDSTLIQVCLSTFNWATFTGIKGALKLHYQFDYDSNIPTFMVITEGKRHEVPIASSQFPILPDSIYCFDKAYVDYGWLYSIHRSRATFVTRPRANMVYKVIGQQPPDPKNDVLSDQTIQFTGVNKKDEYPASLRLVKYYDREENRTFIFLTNNFTASAYTITQIYKARWQIEIFFKWIKQNLKIKTFLGTSPNAVMTQIWIAMCYYLLLAYIKYQSRYKYSLFYLHKIIRVTLLDRLNIIDLLNLNDNLLPKIENTAQQLVLAM
jgi:hypothetical protein